MKTYDEFVRFVSSHPNCVVGAGPVTARACQAAGFGVEPLSFVKEGELVALNLHLPRVVPQSSPPNESFFWLRRFLRGMGSIRRGL